MNERSAGRGWVACTTPAQGDVRGGWQDLQRAGRAIGGRSRGVVVLVVVVAVVVVLEVVVEGQRTRGLATEERRWNPSLR